MTSTPSLNDEELLQQFADTSLPAELFNHRQHVRVAWLYVARDGMPYAMRTFSDSLVRFADAKGAHGLFHVTISWAYLLLINERQQQCQSSDWDSFAAENPDLLTWKPSILDRFYTQELLWSERARRSFVMPDRVP